MLKFVTIFGIRISMYYTFVTLAFILVLLFNFRQRGREFPGKPGPVFRLPKGRRPLPGLRTKKITKSWVWIVVLSAVQFFSGAGLNVLVGKWLTDGSYNYFGFAVLAPWVFVLFCLIVGADPFAYLDAFTPAYALSLASFKVGCFFAGCCKGTDQVLTIHFHDSNEDRFPVQLLECLMAILIFFVLMKIRHKLVRGTAQPTYLLLYSGTRFFTEFLRYEENVFYCFKWYQVLCFEGIIIGVIELLLIMYFMKWRFAGKSPADVEAPEEKRTGRRKK